MAADANTLGQIQSWYKDFLGREASQDESSFWGDQAAKGENVHAKIAGSQEAQSYLGVNQPQSQASAEQKRAAAAGTTYTPQVGTTPDSLPQTVDSWYGQYLGRQADGTERSFWNDQLAKGADAKSAIANSKEANDYTANNWLKDVANTNQGPNKINTWNAGQIGTGDPYYRDAKTWDTSIDADYLNKDDPYGTKSWYKNYLGRDAKADELAYWNQQGANGVDVRSMIAGSDEAKARVQPKYGAEVASQNTWNDRIATAQKAGEQGYGPQVQPSLANLRNVLQFDLLGKNEGAGAAVEQRRMQYANDYLTNNPDVQAQINSWMAHPETNPLLRKGDNGFFQFGQRTGNNLNADVVLDKRLQTPEGMRAALALLHYDSVGRQQGRTLSNEARDAYYAANTDAANLDANARLATTPNGTGNFVWQDANGQLYRHGPDGNTKITQAEADQYSQATPQVWKDASGRWRYGGVDGGPATKDEYADKSLAGLNTNYDSLADSRSGYRPQSTVSIRQGANPSIGAAPSGMIGPGNGTVTTGTGSVVSYPAGNQGSGMIGTSATAMPGSVGSINVQSSGMINSPFLDKNALKQRVIQRPETVAGQMEDLLRGDSAYLDAARAKSLKQMNARGLVNSSIAATAGEAAAIEAAMPIAQSDASTYAKAGDYNTALPNQAEMFNAEMAGKFGMQKMGIDAEMLSQDKSLANQLAIARMNNDTSRYGADLQAQTSRYNADSSAATSRYNADSSAATSRYGTDAQTASNKLQSETSRFNAELNANSSRYNSDMSYRQQMDANRNSLINNILMTNELSPDRKAELLGNLGRSDLAQSVYVGDQGAVEGSLAKHLAARSDARYGKDATFTSQVDAEANSLASNILSNSLLTKDGKIRYLEQLGRKSLADSLRIIDVSADLVNKPVSVDNSRYDAYLPDYLKGSGIDPRTIG